MSSKVWGASLYQAPSADTGVDATPLAPSPLQAASDAAYQFFYKAFPVLAGSAVGVQGAGRSGPIQARGNFQTFDITHGRVENQARWEQLAEGSAGLCRLRLCAPTAACSLKPQKCVLLSFPCFGLRSSEQVVGLRGHCVCGYNHELACVHTNCTQLTDWDMLTALSTC